MHTSSEIDNGAAYTVLDYLRTNHGRLPKWLTDANAWDELILDAWCDWDQRARRHELHARVLRAGLSHADLGRYLGIQTRQGARDYLDRTDALLTEYHRISEEAPRSATGDGATDPTTRLLGRSRASRRADVHAARAARAARRAQPARRDWLNEHHAVAMAVVRDLLEQTARCGLGQTPTGDGDELGDELGDYLHDLQADFDADEYTGATIATLGLALGELRTSPTVTALAANHKLRTSMTAADRLRADYTHLGNPQR